MYNSQYLITYRLKRYLGKCGYSQLLCKQDAGISTFAIPVLETNTGRYQIHESFYGMPNGYFLPYILAQRKLNELSYFLKPCNNLKGI